MFCKVRGEKIITTFLSNEPRYLEPVLSQFEQSGRLSSEGQQMASQSIVPWEERYMLLVLLAHLMLAPFPLTSVSTVEPSQTTSTALGLELPPELPGVVLRILRICARSLHSATKERDAAASLLVRLIVRPDMRANGLQSNVVQWALASVYELSDVSDIHYCLGVLFFMARLVSFATTQDIASSLPATYQLCQKILDQEAFQFARSSAVARKLIVKTFRNIATRCLTDARHVALDTVVIIEEVIEFLLGAVADGDTPVRFAASKALSIITMKLDAEMAGDVVQAILGNLQESVYWHGSKRSLAGVSPLRWHGLTLTLAHLLYRRALAPDQLPAVLNALLLALGFEQRSATGGSVGASVRDAACFGIWALARRYTSAELLAVDTSSVGASSGQSCLSVLQILAIELIVTACLDPSGNIRRGASAALQELIGRHPDTVEEGIALVQIVDFHAVGLRERAMSEVAFKAARLHGMYWNALFGNILDWKGTGSLDADSRTFAATAVGRLAAQQPAGTVGRMATEICSKLEVLPPHEVEERHGLTMALARVVDHVSSQSQSSDQYADALDLTQLWGLFHNVLSLQPKDFTSMVLRPALTAAAVCSLLGSLATLSCCTSLPLDASSVPCNEIIRLLNLCLGRHDETVLETIPRSARTVLRLLSKVPGISRSDIVAAWLEALEHQSSHSGQRGSGYAIALGAAWSLLHDEATVDSSTNEEGCHIRIVKVLTMRCTPAVAISSRTVALQALRVLLENVDEQASDLFTDSIRDGICNALHTALNDYTITERGDVGSLVRLEALNTVARAWSTGLLNGAPAAQQLRTDAVRLSQEKLDKLRLRAAEVLLKDDSCCSSL